MVNLPLIQSIIDFISNRKINGYKTNIYERYMQQFIDYCDNRDINKPRAINQALGSQEYKYCYAILQSLAILSNVRII
jgi:hypothetical protein